MHICQRFLPRTVVLLLLILLLMACAVPTSEVILVTATPSGLAIGGGEESALPSPGATPAVSPPTPTFIPTPDPTRNVVVDPTEEQSYVVQAGDTLSVIAQRYGVTVKALVETNGLPDENTLSVGQTLIIPLSIEHLGNGFKLVPDSGLVNGPSTYGFSVAEFLENRESFLGIYTEDIDGRLLSGAEIIERVALETSVNPRLLLAVLEYETHWISRPMIDEGSAMYPMNYIEQPERVYGLYRQLGWAANLLNTGYYGWRQRGLSATVLADGTRIGLDPTINAGTAGVQVLLSQTRNYEQWVIATDYSGFFTTYVALFGDPFQYTVEPLLPPDLEQPPLGLPWADGELWYYTGGPHGGWGSGSAWAAVDFVSGEQTNSCEVSEDWVRAVAPGVIARNEFGIVILDLDFDGFEGTGWTVFYLHISSEGRAVVEGQRVEQGDPIGHPSCEGGVSFATHVHFARRYNGEWIAADCTRCPLAAPAPQLNLDGWLCYSFGREYDGAFINGDEYREALQGRDPINTMAILEEDD